MAFSMTIELEGGGTVTLDGVVSYTVEEMSEPSPDEVPEDGDEEREGNEEVDMSPEKELRIPEGEEEEV